MPVEGTGLDVIQASKEGTSNHAVWTHALWMGCHQVAPSEQAAWRSPRWRPTRPEWHFL